MAIVVRRLAAFAPAFAIAALALLGAAPALAADITLPGVDITFKAGAGQRPRWRPR